MFRQIICLLLLTSPVLAQTTVSDADLATAYDECMLHRLPFVSIPAWETGWQHCEMIWREHGARARADYVRKKAQPPSISKTVSDKLNSK